MQGHKLVKVPDMTRVQSGDVSGLHVLTRQLEDVTLVFRAGTQQPCLMLTSTSYQLTCSTKACTLSLPIFRSHYQI